MLQRNFHVVHVATASTAARAVSLFASHSIAVEACNADAPTRWVVISDRHLPDGTGDALVGRFRREAPGLTILGLTGDGTTRDVEAFKAAGCSDVLVKPASVAALAKWLPRKVGEGGGGGGGGGASSGGSNPLLNALGGRASLAGRLGGGVGLSIAVGTPPTARRALSALPEDRTGGGT
jgi:CheY-like chemotaxis protein